MTETEVRAKILDLFNKVRQSPNEPFEASHFLDFLSDPPYPPNTIRNSFKGVKRFHRFMDTLELEFGICFTLADIDRYYSVDSLTKKVIERQKKRRGNLMILKRRNDESESYWIEIVLVSLLIFAYFWFGFHWFPILLTVLFGMIIWWIIDNKIHNRQHNKKLSQIIRKEK